MERKILGIDPGSRTTGFAILAQQSRMIRIVECGDLKFPLTSSLPERVTRFYDFFSQQLVLHKPELIAIETSFLGKNAQTFLKLGYFRGIIYLLSCQHQCTLGEFAPREVKESTTGFGGASKEQVASVLHRFFPGLQHTIKKHDVTDAIAVALTGSLRSSKRAALAKI